VEEIPEGRDVVPPLPASPTGRVPQWVLDEAARLAAPPLEPSRAPARHRRPRRLRGVLLVVVLLALLGAAALVVPRPWPWEALVAGNGPGEPPVPAPELPLPSVAPAAPPTDRPSPGLETAPKPLGEPPAPPAGGGPHAFAATQVDGVTPVAYDPCRPVHYVLRPDAAPPGAEELVHDAVARISEVTGLRFVFDGPTDEVPAEQRAVFQPDRYGDRWAPVLIAWRTEAEDPRLAGDFVGVGGSAAVSLGDGPRVYVTGTVVLDADQLPPVLDRPGGAAGVRAVVLHELAHLVGLDHVDDETQLLHPRTRGERTEFGSGDLTGLAALGRGACVPDL
jgi:hypothetical protein